MSFLARFGRAISVSRLHQVCFTFPPVPSTCIRAPSSSSFKRGNSTQGHLRPIITFSFCFASLFTFSHLLQVTLSTMSSLLKALAFGALAAPALAMPWGSHSRVAATTAATQASQNLCGNSQSLILSNTPWIVFNMFYGAAQSVGTQCTNYDSQTTSSAGTKEVVWSSATNIEYVEATNNVPKGYSFVGLTQNLETQISAIQSIPATYDWTRTNTTAFKGNVCFDFMTSDTKGDSTSSSAHELMLWLQYEGGQLPIGWPAGAVATIDNLYGTSWKLYEGKNDDTGITVHSLVPETQFKGTFSGDIKDWLKALVSHGTFTDSTYVNVGNAGTEYFYGHSNLNATLGLQINL